jgi:hypothetical protein
MVLRRHGFAENRVTPAAWLGDMASLHPPYLPLADEGSATLDGKVRLE